MSVEEFERLCRAILEAEGFLVIGASGASADVGIDFLAQPPNSNESWIVLCKKMKSTTECARRLRELVGHASNARSVMNASHAMLIVSSRIPSEHIRSIEELDHVTIWDFDRIATIIRRPSALREQFGSFVEEQQRLEQDAKSPLTNDSRGADLLRRLSEVRAGIESWRQYEDVSIEILNHVFIPPFRVPLIQSISEDELDRRDAIYPLSMGNSTWDGIAAQFRTRFVVAEFKNHLEAPDQKDVEAAAQYLLPKGMRTLCLLCTRKPPSKSALKARRRAWMEADKLVLLLSDEDMRDLLIAKAGGEDPTVIIENKINEFLQDLCP